MGTVLVTPPTLDPVSLAEARAHCRVDSNDDDGLLLGYILAARSYTETYLRRALISQTWDMTIDYDWPQVVDRHLAHRGFATYRSKCVRDRIVLPRPPTISVTSVQYVDVSGALQTLDSGAYIVAKLETGEHALEPVYGTVFPAIQRQLGAITVRFIAGYGASPGSIPEPIRQAMLLLISHWYDLRGVEVARISQELPYGVDALLSSYRVFY